jgi:hypothetical protein
MLLETLELGYTTDYLRFRLGGSTVSSTYLLYRVWDPHKLTYSTCCENEESEVGVSGLALATGG